MAGLPVKVENTDPGCCYNTDSISELLTPTSSFDATGKERNSTSRGITSESK